MLLIFPEGTRTRDGTSGELKPGFLALARRSKVPLLPVVVDGAFDSWPKWNMVPGVAVIHVRFAEPLSPEEMSQLDDEQLLAEVDHRIRECHAVTRKGRLRSIASRNLACRAGS